MKIYEWTYQGRTGTLNANNTKEAKSALVSILRGDGATSARVPKGTVVRKIGLTKAKKQSAKETAKEPTKSVPAAVPAHPEYNFQVLTKDTSFTNCIIRYPDGTCAYVGDIVTLILPKGTRCCKLPAW